METSTHTGLITSATNGHQELENVILESLDIEAWEIDLGLSGFYDQLERKIYPSVKKEEEYIKRIRNEIFPNISSKNPELPTSGVQGFTVDQIRKAHNGLLFNGGVTAVDGTRVTHDTLPMTVTQIGVCQVAYNGNYGSYMHRLFQRDLVFEGGDPVKELWEMLEARKKRSNEVSTEEVGRFSEMSQRGLMAYAERAVLMERVDPSSPWRMGHGNPFPYEMLSNFWASKPDVTRRALDLLTRIVEHKRFVFVPSSPGKHLVTIGNALKAREYILIETAKIGLEKIVSQGHARSVMLDYQKDFINKYGSQVVVGLFKSTDIAPPHVFYAHRDYARTAALIAIADGILQEHRGFPMLIDLADQICYSTFHPETFFASVRQAYADAGQPFRFLGERETRNR